MYTLFQQQTKYPIQCRCFVLRSHMKCYIVLYFIRLLFYFMCGRRIVLSARFFFSTHECMFANKRNPYIQTPHIIYTEQLSTIQYNKLSHFIFVLCLILFHILIIPFPTINIRNRKGHPNLCNIIVFYFIRLSI